jgi:methionyl aminopeptidase
MPQFQQIAAMQVGGPILGAIRDQLIQELRVGQSFAEIEARAQILIRKAGARPSFSTVPGYDWATCVMRNHELCHGIPDSKKRVEDGDIITIDIGLLWEGFHLDTTTSVLVGDPEVYKQQVEFLRVGRAALAAAIAIAAPATSVYDLSRAMIEVLRAHSYQPVYQLTGHGIGASLHMEPSIPVLPQKADKKIKLSLGQTVAIEVMYTAGTAQLRVADDGWTYQTADGSLSGMFEETVLITPDGNSVLTQR